MTNGSLKEEITERTKNAGKLLSNILWKWEMPKKGMI
jgi:hypothetical protein